MSASSFKFVSPGIFINEIDQSQLPREANKIGPVVIGRAVKGPIMKPITVKSQLEFIEIFGLPVPGSSNVDFWREGNKSAPTYGGFAALAYLKSTGPLTYIRLGGYEHPEKTMGGEAGWSTSKAYGIFLGEYDGSTIEEATHVATIYSNGTVLPYGKYIAGSTAEEKDLMDAVKVENDQIGLSIDGKVSYVNFNKLSKKFIRDVLNTSPTKLNADITSSTEEYFLGASFEELASDILANAAGDVGFMVVELGDSAASFKKEAAAAESGTVFAQHKGLPTDFVKVDGKLPVQELFKFYTLSEDDWAQKNLKISIENIAPSKSNYTKFGTFSVVIRALGDSDDQQVIHERFDLCTLDPASPSYVAKKIGDLSYKWDYEESRFKSYGMYENKSKYIRVEMDPEVDSGAADADLLPHGFYGPKKLKDTLAGAGVIPAFGLTNGVNVSATATFKFGAPSLIKTIADDHYLTSLKSIYWGLKTNIGNKRTTNKEMQEYFNVLPAVQTASSEEISFAFTLQDVKGTYTDGVFSSVSYEDGSRLAETALQIDSDQLLAGINKFTMPLFGGFDGLDILEAEPFNNTRALAEDEDETSSYAINSLKVALDMVADPEAVEINGIVVPGVTATAIHSKMLSVCENRGDALAILDLQGDYKPASEELPTGPDSNKPNVKTAISYVKDSLSVNSSYGAAYFPWVLARDPNSASTLWIPPSVAALGSYGYSEKNAELWFAPAGFNRGGLSEGEAGGLPIIGVSHKLNAKERDDLYATNINPIASFPSEGIVIFGQKTLQVTPSALDRVNVRRLMNYLKKEISRMAATLLFDPNVQVTWDRFTGKVNPFLSSVKSRLGLSDFKVVLDESTTTPDLIDRNILYAKIFLKPTRAIEFIALDFNITNSGASFKD